ncbi:uncharacterized protein K452DRAFT_30995 [Aplosporella prunicola CBS 121167]|uniref:Uncharacterized protein n=1 Tax=Aplosporella prunicola CBS 121167 TaxID=1176127 RepID=A0A6A6BDZ4_9PEZI|nr:uncharacterized protein K452DRAFT_30995 [Aplosporella prunicola CBS 121167]KAF2141613.1 hypothetical protein K452DRAFT_30995 [Aplosporella prunicola CBS 121167]
MQVYASFFGPNTFSGTGCAKPVVVALVCYFCRRPVTVVTRGPAKCSSRRETGRSSGKKKKMGTRSGQSSKDAWCRTVGCGRSSANLRSGKMHDRLAAPSYLIPDQQAGTMPRHFRQKFASVVKVRQYQHASAFCKHLNSGVNLSRRRSRRN